MSLSQRFFLIVTLIATCGAVPAAAADLSGLLGKTAWQQSAPSKIQVTDKGGAIVETARYLVNSPHNCHPNSGETIVVAQRTVWKIGPFEGHDPTLEARAYRVTTDGKSAQLWTIKDHSDEGRLACDYYETIWYGCCSAVPNHRLFNPKTGKLLMEYSERLITVEVPNSPLKRFIGYKPSETIVLNAWEKHKRHIGTLTYASPDGILHRIAIRGIGKFEDKFTMGLAKIQIRRGLPKQEMNGNTLQLWDVDASKDAQQIGGFTVILKYAGALVEVPVQNDDFAIGSSKFASHEIIRLQN